MTNDCGEALEIIMNPYFNTILTVICTLIASSGFWAFIQKYNETNTAERQMLVGLAHDRIVYLGMAYVERGYITKDEYENLNDYLFKPYKKLGGNGSAQRIMIEVDKLQIKNFTSGGKRIED